MSHAKKYVMELVTPLEGTHSKLCNGVKIMDLTHT